MWGGCDVNAATLIQGILIYAILGWKSFQLSRAGRDLPLRCVVAVFACAGAAWPIGVAYSLHLVPAGARWLMFAQPALLLGCIFSLNLFFLFSLLPPERARRRAVSRAVVLTVLVAGMAAAAATVPAYTGMTGPTARGTNVMYLVFNAGMAGFLADAWIWARRGIRQADPAGARALRIVSWGFALMTAGLVPLAADVAIRVFGTAAPPVLASAGGLLVLSGILLFLVGIAYPTARDRTRALRLWNRHRRTYRELGPLWRALHEVFPEGTLPARLPSSRWLEAVTPWHARRRAVRRQLECRDGLVRISPYIRPETGEDDLAGRILTALGTVDPSSLRPGKAMPIAIPQARTADTDIVADAAELVRLSRTIGAARSRDVLPSAIR